MNTIPTTCPFCGGEMYVTHLYCRDCDTNVEGRFVSSASGPLSKEQLAFIERFVARLSVEQLTFVETFVRCEGKMNRMEIELGISYPTIRNRLNEIISILGYEPGVDEPALQLDKQNAEKFTAKRQMILEELDAGKISAQDAMRMLQEEV